MLNALRSLAGLLGTDAAAAQCEPSVFTEHLSLLALVLDRRIAAGRSWAEELQHASVDCIASVLRSFPPAAQQVLRSDQLLPVLGHCVAALLACAAPDRGAADTPRQTKVAALTALGSLGRCVAGECEGGGAALAPFLPGIVSGLGRAIDGDFKQGHTVVVAALDAWSAVVAPILDNARYAPIAAAAAAAAAAPSAVAQADLETGQLQVGSSGASASAPIAEHGSQRQLRVRCDREWWSETSENVGLLLERMSTVASAHPMWKARLAFVRLAETIVTRCGDAMILAIPVLVETLVILSEDDFDTVAHAATQTLDAFGAKQLGTDMLSLVKENVLGLAIALPRVVRGEDDAAILRSMRLMAGYIRLLGPQVRVLLRSTDHMSRLSAALLQVLELDGTDLRLIAERCVMQPLWAALYPIAHAHLLAPGCCG